MKPIGAIMPHIRNTTDTEFPLLDTNTCSSTVGKGFAQKYALQMLKNAAQKWWRCPPIPKQRRSVSIVIPTGIQPEVAALRLRPSLWRKSHNCGHPRGNWPACKASAPAQLEWKFPTRPLVLLRTVLL